MFDEHLSTGTRGCNLEHHGPHSSVGDIDQVAPEDDAIERLADDVSIDAIEVFVGVQQQLMDLAIVEDDAGLGERVDDATGAGDPIVQLSGGGVADRAPAADQQRAHGSIPYPAMPPEFASPYRTHTCGELRASDAGKSVRLSGWVNRRRDQGGLIFLDLRDRYGVTQVVIDRNDAPSAHEAASRVRGEFVVTVAGQVAKRLDGTENKRLPTGEIELQGSGLTILN